MPERLIPSPSRGSIHAVSNRFSFGFARESDSNQRVSVVLKDCSASGSLGWMTPLTAVHPEPEKRYEGPVRRWELIFLAAFWVSIVGAAFWQSTKEYFDNDELCTALLVSTPSFSEMWNVIRHGGELNPPLFFIIEWVMARIGGVTETVLRGISFVSVAFGGWMLFFTVRPFVGPRIGALAIALILGLSRDAFYFAGRARYYGFFFFLVTVAIWLAVRPGSRRELRWPQYTAMFLTHCLMVYLHLFGLLFSGVVLVAMAVADGLAKRWRWRLYGSVIAAWVAFGAWLPSMTRQVKSAGAYTPPGYHSIGYIVEQLSLETPFALILLLIAVLGGLALILKRPATAVEEALACDSPFGWISLALMAGALLAVPIGTWIGSFLITALFMPRYVFPSIAGWVLVTTMVLLAVFRLPRGNLQLRWAISPRIWSIAWFGVLVFCLLFQPMRAWKNAARAPTPFIDADYGYEKVPIVFENSWPYMKRAVYGRGREYLLYTDSNASKADPNWYTGFVEQYFKSYYPRFPQSPSSLPGVHVAHYEDLPQTFLAVDDDMTKTFEWLFKNKPDLKVRLLGSKKADPEYFGEERVYLVQKSLEEKEK